MVKINTIRLNMEALNKVLLMTLAGVSTVFLGFITYFGNQQVERLEATQGRLATIEINQVKQQSNQEVVVYQISAVRQDLEQIRSAELKSIEEIKRNTDKLQIICKTMGYYWNDHRCDK